MERARREDEKGWVSLRFALWPQSDLASHAREITEILAGNDRTPAFIAKGDDGQMLGFAEASLRHDYVNGCETSPVAFLEGIYVCPEARGLGVARQLVAHVEVWARSTGCVEMASDALLGNTTSHAMHQALGFIETQRVVYF
ncbi:aminoglycoside 6'-N-acetyltransferase [Pelagibacterium limicola]|uniref:aminoglycoside 6'-N-acetyltransferase n=1 Tax=Pelagibacterium limicola TaxID=2791022 RepID=UPI003CCCDCFE